MKNKTIDELKAENVADVLKNGPGLSYKRNTFIKARNLKAKRILVGGLGALGVGEMWFDETDAHRNYPGYKEAPDEDCGWIGLGEIE